MFDFFKINEKDVNWKWTFSFIIIAYLFSIFVRFIYIGEVSGFKDWYWHDQLMINNVDGYYYAEGARDILRGFHQPNDLSPIHNPLAISTAFLSKHLHISLDTIIFYLPGIIGSLIVIPVVLIGRILGSSFIGFLAALLAGIAWSYYHRTMFGYYDTDMLTVVLPTFTVWGVMLALKTKNKKLFFIAPLFEIIMNDWHGGLYNISNAIFIMAFIYLLYLKFIKKENVIIETFFLLFLLIPLLHLSILTKIILLALLYIAELKVNIKLLEKKYLLWGIFGFYLLIVGLPWIIGVLQNGYFTRAVNEAKEGLKFYDVVNTVHETANIGYDMLAHRISGSWIGLIIGVIGYILLMLRYPLFWVSLPMVVLGFFAIRGGLRFTIFAVPFIALGDAYIAYLTAKSFSKVFINDKFSLYSKYILAFLIMAGFIYPNYKHVYSYITPATFYKQEVKTLEQLKKIAKRDDYVLTWWDYGYPIRYYADVKTLIDGAKHAGDVNFPVSFALTRPFLPSYNMAILDTYFTEEFYKHPEKYRNKTYVKAMMEYLKTKDADDFLEKLNHKIALPKIKEDIYYFLPYRMISIFPTVAIFSYIDLKSGKIKRNPFFVSTTIKGEDRNQNTIFSNGMALTKKGILIMNRKKYLINSFIIVAYDGNGKFIRQIQRVKESSPLYVIWMKSYGKVLILDKNMFNSTYIQMFVLRNYDPNLFEPVILNPWIHIYKVKK